MVVQVETQDRVRHLLREALPMLCKSGLAFASEFSVEALIGITLNKNDVFLVSIKETVKSETGEDDNGEKSLEVSVSRTNNLNDSASSSQRRKPHRKRRRSKTSPSRGSDSEGSDYSSDECEDTTAIKREKLERAPGSVNEYENTTRVQSETNFTHTDIKPPQVDEDDDSNDAVIVKEEPADSDFSNVSFGGGQSFDLSGYSHGTTLPLTSSAAAVSSPLSQSLPIPGPSYGQPVQMVPNLTQHQGGEGQATGAPGSMKRKERRMKELTRENEPLHMVRVHDNKWMCRHCHLISAYKRAVKLHVVAKHLEMKRYSCRFCGQVFKWNASRLDHERLSCPEKARLWMPFFNKEETKT